MIITCPDCVTSYEIPQSSLGAHGRMVRCANCKHRWYVEPPLDDDDLDLEIFDEEKQHLERAVGARHEPRRGPGFGALAMWLLAAVFALSLAGLVVAREDVVGMFPDSAKWYQRFGLPIQQEVGLEFVQLDLKPVDEESGEKTFVFVLEIQNVVGQSRKVPPVRITLLDQQRREIQYGLFDPPVVDLAPGETTTFEARWPAAPQTAVNYAVSFDATPDP